MRTLIRAAALAVAASLLVIGPAAVADRDGEGFPPPDPNNTGNPGSGTGESTDSGGTNYGQVDNCSIVSSPSYLGMACAGGDWDRRSIRQILDGDKLPGCWHDPMTPAEVEAMMLSTEGGVSWYWYRCLKGIDPVTLKVGDDGVTFTTGIVSLEDPGQVVHLTENQHELVDFYDQDGQIPSPVAGVSPMANPRVGAWVSFFDGTDGVVTVTAGGVRLEATVTELTVEPLGAGLEPTLTCAGTGYRAQRGDTADNTAGGCWYRYERSSANQPGMRYPVNITAHWDVWVYRGDGTRSLFNTFDKSQVTTIPVTEIEALVVR